MFILNVNGVLCFPHSTILQGNARVFRRNVDKPKWKLELEWKIFLLWHSKKLYIAV
jgi:hypothetical protein